MNKKWIIQSIVVSITFILFCSGLIASPVESDTACRIVKTLLAHDDGRFAKAGNKIEVVDTFVDDNNLPVYHIVYLQPSGFIIVAADDEVEPIIAIVNEYDYDPSEGNPLGDLIFYDLTQRVSSTRELHKKFSSGKSESNLSNTELTLHHTAQKALARWNKLMSADLSQSSGIRNSLSSISDIRVSPLVKTKWGQATTTNGKACFNYYTPPYGDGEMDNYVCGCVATAMAQCMYYYQYPTAGVGTASFNITVDGGSEGRNLRGGDGNGGPYNWAQMVQGKATDSTTLTQRQAMGALASDAGVSVHMDYGYNSSGAYIEDAKDALINVFGYSNAKYEWNWDSGIPTEDIYNMVNANLDYNNPVIMGAGNHAFVCDGYGYQGTAMYHHLNMGWDGYSDLWYNLPEINNLDQADGIDELVYNIYTSGTGEIISGRILDDSTGLPLPNVTVKATDAFSHQFSSTTNSKGIYAIAKISNANFNVTAQKDGYDSASRFVNINSGNAWGIDFSLQLSDRPVPNIIGMTATQANAAINAAGLKPVNGGNEYCNATASGLINSQTPASGVVVSARSNVTYKVSLGKPVVPNVIGKPASYASDIITSRSLISQNGGNEYSNISAAGLVSSLIPSAGTAVNTGTIVTYKLSLGKPKVPYLYLKTPADANTLISNVALIVGTISYAHSNTFIAGNIMLQSPAPYKSVLVNSAVNYVISLGKPTVPNIVDETFSAANTAITAEALAIGKVTSAYSDTIVAGNVISQNPAAAAEVTINSKVSYVKSLGKPKVPVIVAKKVKTANAAITGVSLTIGTVTYSYSDTVSSGYIISQAPAANTEVLVGSVVDYVVSLGKPVVPKITGKTQATANDAITNAGLTVGAVTESYSTKVPAGSVIIQTPAAGKKALIGSKVDYVKSLGKP